MVKNFIHNLLRSNRHTADLFAALLLMKQENYLKQVGWYNSFIKTMPVTKDGDPLPWYTYAAIDFLSSRVDKSMIIFEFGSGNSTIWWAKHVSRVVSCEHDEEWFSKMKSELPENVTYKHFDLSPAGNYSKSILEFDKEFDVIVIDGRERVNCAKSSLSALKDNGVIIWDNSDREQYLEGYEFLADNGFKRLDFSGLGPINVYGWCTSIFYRTENCFGI